MIFRGERISIRLLNQDDVGEAYLRWMNDPEITQYLESRWKAYAIDDLREYVVNINKNNNEYLLGIFNNIENKHIGNLKIGGINWIHRYADIGIIIGEKDYWGKGFGVEAIRLGSVFAFDELNLNKITAGVYSNNEGSKKIFIKSGFEQTGILKKHMICEGKYIDKILFDKFNSRDS